MTEPLTDTVRPGPDSVPPMPADYQRPDRLPKTAFGMACLLYQHGRACLRIVEYLDSRSEAETTYARATVAEIAQAIDSSPRGVHQSLKRLDELGWIKIHPVTHPNQPWTLFWLGWKLPEPDFPSPKVDPRVEGGNSPDRRKHR